MSKIKIFLFAFCLFSSVANADVISVDFLSVEAKNVIKLLAKEGNFQVSITNNVNGLINIKAKDEPLNILYKIAKSNNLSIKNQDGLYIIDSYSSGSSANFDTLVFKLKHARATDLTLMFQSKTLLSENASYFLDTRTNTVIVQDFPEKLSFIKASLQALDLPLKQVLVNATIVQVDDSISEQKGVDWSFKGSDSSAKYTLGDVLSNSNVFFKLVDTTSSMLSVQISALEKKGLAKVVSRPIVLTYENSEAVVSSGREIPYTTSTTTSTGLVSNVQFKKALLSLTVTPTISDDGTIFMKVGITNDSLASYAKNGEAILSTNTLNTSLSVMTGSTVVLGGVFVDSDLSDNNSVPFLSKIPYIKNAFSSKSKEKKKQQLLIFLTPTIQAEQNISLNNSAKLI